GLGHDLLGFLGKAFDFTRLIAAITTGNSAALVKLIDAIADRQPPASGDLAKMITTLPKVLFTDAARHLIEAYAASGQLPGGPHGHVGQRGGTATPGLVTVARFLMTHGASRAAAAGIAGTVAGESTGNPESVGTGGA